MGVFEYATQRFLQVGPKEAKPLPVDVVTTVIRVPLPSPEHGASEVAVKVHTRGTGPAALVVHGWRSQAADMESISAMLASAGFQVWMPDLPGHGHSEGEQLSIPLAAATLRAVTELSGPFAVAVGHSYGGASLVHALVNGLDVRRVAVLAAPTHYGRFARQAALQAGMPEGMLEPWLVHLGARIGCHPDEIDMRRQVGGLDMPALVIHSRDDRVAPFEEMAEVAAVWKGAEWMPLEGLGHFRVLGDGGMLAQILHFAKANDGI